MITRPRRFIARFAARFTACFTACFTARFSARSKAGSSTCASPNVAAHLTADLGTRLTARLVAHPFARIVARRAALPVTERRWRALLLTLVCATPAAHASLTTVRLQLNWAQGADHAPLYYALEQGWFAQRGVDLRVTPGGGSAFTLDAVAGAEFDLGIADLFTVMRGWARGTPVTAVMNLFANAPHSFYWLRDSGIRGLQDLPGRRLGTLREDPARRLWRVLAARAGIDPDSVTWVDMAHNMKVDALAAGRIDVATNAFFHNHAAYESAFGARLVELPWRTLGFNPYSNTLIVRQDFLLQQRDATAAVVQTLQRAVAVCLRTPAPCLEALLRANPHLEAAPTQRNWALVETLLRPMEGRGVVGVLREDRLRADYAVLAATFGVEQSFETLMRVDASLLDADIRHDP